MRLISEMSIIRFSVLSLLVMFLGFSFYSSVCIAMEPRFELDTEQIQKFSTILNHGKKRNNPAGNSRYAKSGRSVLRFQKATDRKEDSTFHSDKEFRTTYLTEADLEMVSNFWRKMVPQGEEPLQPLVFKSDIFDLSIDPLRYPLFKAADGKKILLDLNGSLPPLVSSLIQERDPSVRVVNAVSKDGSAFIGALLSAGNFYSIEEQPVMTFGTDPKLKIRVDYKVERTAESVMRNEVMLVTASRQAFSPRLTDYIKRHGFNLLEPFADSVETAVPLRHRIVHASPAEPGEAVDLLLETVGLPAEKNRRLELFKRSDTGISLSVTAERYFERAGKRYVVATFSGDPVAYTLFRLLETKGYKVLILQPDETFKSVTSKLLSKMELPSGYTSHLLVADPKGRYSFEISGFMLENTVPGGGALMLTDRPVERSIREFLYDHGYQVQER